MKYVLNIVFQGNRISHMFVMAPKFISPKIDDPCPWLMKTSCLEPPFLVVCKGRSTLKRVELKCYIFECTHLE